MSNLHAERAAAYRKRQREERNLTQIRLWVPTEKESIVRAAITAALEGEGCDLYTID